MTHKFELLSPAGEWDSLIAAIENGADAVYIGGKSFSARSFAGNFNQEEVERATQYAHSKSRKIYVAVNTLLFDREMEDALQYVNFLYETGVNAVILQDYGLASLVKQFLPDMPMHASTQMTSHNLQTIMMLEKLGFQRAILERQLNLEQIRHITSNSNIEIEVFAHGALCISYSGQCLMSSIIGGRSGNRGKCAQPCRFEYQLLDKKGNHLVEALGPYLLSTKDLFLLERIPDLVLSGASGIKIEGRMKRPEYVAIVTRIYRKAIDLYMNDPEKFTVSSEDERQLRQIFNRDFTEGFFSEQTGTNLMSFKRPNNRGVLIGRVIKADWPKNEVLIKLEETVRIGDGVEVWVSIGGRNGFTIQSMKVNHDVREEAYDGETVSISTDARVQVGDRVFRTFDRRLMHEAQTSYQGIDTEVKVPIQFHVVGKVGHPLKLLAKDFNGNEVEVESDECLQQATKRPMTFEMVRKQLDKTGGTRFIVTGYTWDLDQDIFVAVSIVNDLRRKALELLISLHSDDKKKADEGIWRWHNPAESTHMQNNFHIPKLSVTVSDINGLKAAIKAGASVVYFSMDHRQSDADVLLSEWESISQLAKQHECEVVSSFSSITKDNEFGELSQVMKYFGSSQAIMAANLGVLKYAKDFNERAVYFDYPLYVFNSITAEAFKDIGAKRITLSPELTLEQIKKLRIPSDVETECLVHGRLQIMITDHCLSSLAIRETRQGEESCNMSCKHDDLILKDSAGYQFPVSFDSKCRMHVYNSRELCLYDNLYDICNAPVDIIRIEAKDRNVEYIQQVVAIYSHWLERAASGEFLSVREISASKYILEELSENGITKGHYFRGVE